MHDFAYTYVALAVSQNGTLKTEFCTRVYMYYFVVHLFETISIFIVLIMHTNVNHNYVVSG